MPYRIAADAREAKTGMTLGELAEFVDRATAVGCTADQPIKATVTMRGRVKTLTLADRDEPRR
jgi:hypothetical protein